MKLKSINNVRFPVLFLVLGGLLVVSFWLGGIGINLGQVGAASNSPSCWNYDQTADNWTQTDCGLRGNIVNNCLVIDGGFAICNGTASLVGDTSASQAITTQRSLYDRIFDIWPSPLAVSSPR